MSIKTSSWAKTSKSRNVVLLVAGVILMSSYPLYFYPKSRKSEYEQIQAINRRGIDKEAIQPGGFKPWTDPFAAFRSK
uniref:Small integral membrane protein 20 n=1 Tax=Tetranychus urticae TaxID=32264 RepID=T1JT59_TETUR